MVSHRSNRALRLYCHARRFIRRSRPVRLGQTTAGLVVAAALIMLWGLERPAAAIVVAPTGSVESQFFVLEWNYDLEGGTGWLNFRPKTFIHAGGYPADGVVFQDARFTTRGAVLENTTPEDWWHRLSDPVVVGQAGGLPLLEYKLDGGLLTLSGTVMPSFRFHGTGKYGEGTYGTSGIGSAVISSLLPVRLATTQLVYTPKVYDYTHGYYAELPEESLEFVTVEAIPEADINRDGTVDVVDLLTLSAAWNTVAGGPNYNPASDLNHDGTVDVLDLLILADNWPDE